MYLGFSLQFLLYVLEQLEKQSSCLRQGAAGAGVILDWFEEWHWVSGEKRKEEVLNVCFAGYKRKSVFYCN